MRNRKQDSAEQTSSGLLFMRCALGAVPGQRYRCPYGPWPGLLAHFRLRLLVPSPQSTSSSLYS